MSENNIMYRRYDKQVNIPAVGVRDGDLSFAKDTSSLFVWDAVAGVQKKIGGSGAVASVFGRTGSVVAQPTDYNNVPSLSLTDGSGQSVLFNTSSKRVELHTNSGAGLEVGAAPDTGADFDLFSSGEAEIYADNGGGQGHFVGNWSVEGELIDGALQPGTDGQLLSSTASGVLWIDAPIAPVISVAGRVGVVTLAEGDIANLTADLATLTSAISSEASTRASQDTSHLATAEAYTDTETARAEAAEALLAPKASPTFTGHPVGVTEVAGTNSTRLASTGYADAAVAVETSRAQTAEALAEVLTHKDAASGYAGLDASTRLKAAEFPAFTGDITTTAGGVVSVLKSTGTAGTYTKVTTDAQGRVLSGTTLAAGDIPTITESQVTNLTSDLALKAPLASPALTGSPTAPTQSAGDNSTKIANTTYVDAPATGGTPIVQIPMGFGGVIPYATPAASVILGSNNLMRGIYFVSDYDITISTVKFFLSTGVAASKMGVAIYSGDGLTKLTTADAIVTTGSGVVISAALSASIVLKKKVGYWLMWTGTSSSLQLINVLQTTDFQSVYNATLVRSGDSGTATSGGVMPSSIGTMSSAQLRVPTFYFE